MKLWNWIAPALLLGTHAAASGQMVQINERHTVRPDAIVSLDAVSHGFVVTGWDRNEVQITGAYDSSVDEIDVGGDDTSYHFGVGPKQRSFFRRRSSSGGNAQLEVRVPAGVRISIETVSGMVEVSALRGAVAVKSVSGSLEVSGNLTAATLGSVSGRVRYLGNAPLVRMEAVSGSVEYRGKARDVRAEAVSGAVVVEGEWETLEASAVSGSVRLSSERPVRTLDAEAVSGSIRFSGPLTKDARVEIESHSGMVELVLPSSTDARFELSSFSGDVISRLRTMKDEIRSQSRRGPPHQSLAFTTGSGSARVTASSFSGTVRVLEQGRN